MDLPGAGTQYRVDDLLVDTACARVTRDGNELALPGLTFDLLIALIEAAPGMATADLLLQRVWPGLVISPETLSQRVKLLRDALGDDPKQPRYVVAVRGRGYRLIAPVARIETSAPDAVTAQAVPRRTRSPVLWMIAVALLLAGTATFVLQRQRAADIAGELPGATLSTPPRSVAVLPFEHPGAAPGSEVLAFGIAEAVLHQLADMKELLVIARTSSFALRGQDADARAIGRKLNVRYLLEGSVQSDKDRLRVTAQLIDTSTGAHVWSMRFDRTPRDIFAVQDEIAVEVARALQLTLDPRVTARLTGQGTTNFDAYLAFLQARALLATSRVIDMKAAIEHLSQAIRMDPAFAAAYVELAGAQVLLAEFEVTDDRQVRFEVALRRASQLIEKALAIDDANGEAYVQRAYVRAFTDIQGAESDYRRAVEISPNNAKAYAGLATVLFELPARRNEALAMLDRARLLDPLEPRHDVSKAVFLLYGRGDARAASELLVAVLKRDPLYGPALMRLAEVRFLQGESAESAKCAEQALGFDQLSEWTRHVAIAAYLDANDATAAASVIQEAPHKLAVREIQLQGYRQDWRRAGENAYAALAGETLSPIDEPPAVAAIRMHARVTGEYSRARTALETLTGVTWSETGDPILNVRVGNKDGLVGLADILQQSGERERAIKLLLATLDNIDYEARQLGRGDLWYWHPRAMAQTLLGNSDSAIGILQELVASGTGLSRWRYFFELEPSYAPLRSDPRFIALLATVRQRAAIQHERLVKLRSDGLLRTRS